MVMLPYHYKNVRIVDIDGVLLELKPITEYFTKPAVAFKAAKEILNGWFNNGDYILLWTARPEEYRQLTMQQLDENGFKYHQLLMNKPQADDCIHIYDDANMEFHKVNKYQGLASSFGKENSYYDQIVEESRKAGKLVLPKEIEQIVHNACDQLEKDKELAKIKQQEEYEKHEKERKEKEKKDACYEGCVKYCPTNSTNSFWGIRCKFIDTFDCYVYDYLKNNRICNYPDNAEDCCYANTYGTCADALGFDNDEQESCTNIKRDNILKNFLDRKCIGFNNCTFFECDGTRKSCTYHVLGDCLRRMREDLPKESIGKLAENMQDVPLEFNKAFREHYIDILAGSDTDSAEENISNDQKCDVDCTKNNPEKIIENICKSITPEIYIENIVKMQLQALQEDKDHKLLVKTIEDIVENANIDCAKNTIIDSEVNE